MERSQLCKKIQIKFSLSVSDSRLGDKMPAISKSPWRMSWFSFCLAGVTGDARCDGFYGWIIKQRPIFEEKDVAIYCKTERICRWETLMYNRSNLSIDL